MKSSIFLFFSLFLTANLSAQFGLSGNIISAQADNWEDTYGSNGESVHNLPGMGWQAGIDYRFGFQNYRIDFLPTLSVSMQEGDSGVGILPFTTKTLGAHFIWNTNIYIFDLEGDCDCPTWSKEGPTFKKGLYVQISPGVSYFRNNIDNGLAEYTSSNIAFNIGGGIGFDIGFSDYFTLTPFGSIRYYPRVDWSDLDSAELAIPHNVQSETTLIHFNAGLRLGIQL